MSTPPAGATVVAPARPTIAQPDAPIDPSLMVNIMLSVGQVNHVLAVLGKQPLGEVLDLFQSIQGQGNMAIAAMRLGATNGATNGAQPAIDPPGLSNGADHGEQPPARRRGAKA